VAIVCACWFGWRDKKDCATYGWPCDSTVAFAGYAGSAIVNLCEEDGESVSVVQLCARKERWRAWSCVCTHMSLARKVAEVMGMFPSSKFQVPPRWGTGESFMLRSTEGREHGTRMTASRLLHRQRLLCHSVTAARGSLPLCLQLLDIQRIKSCCSREEELGRHDPSSQPWAAARGHGC
jgi:hypothetical protein